MTPYAMLLGVTWGCDAGVCCGVWWRVVVWCGVVCRAVLWCGVLCCVLVFVPCVA
jgi:hypothetical protein